MCYTIRFMYEYALTPDKYLSKEEEAFLRANLAKHRDGDLRNTTMVLLMLVCGLRAQEVLNLEKEDFNFNDKSLFVKTIKRGRPRIIPLTTDLVLRFKELFERTEGPRLFAISLRHLTRIWWDYRPCKKGTHALRHTAAKNIYQKTKDFSLAQAFLGHKQISTTAVYLQIQVSADELRDAVS